MSMLKSIFGELNATENNFVTNTTHPKAEPADYDLLKKAGLWGYLQGDAMIRAYRNGRPDEVGVMSGSSINWKPSPNRDEVDCRNAKEYIMPYISGKKIVGDWRWGAWNLKKKTLMGKALTKDEIEYLGAKYGLPRFHYSGAYNNEDEGEMKELDINGKEIADYCLMIHDGMVFDFDTPHDVAIFNVLAAQEGNGFTEDRKLCNATDPRFWIEYSFTNREEKKKEVDRKLEAAKLVDKPVEFKCEVIEYLAFEFPELVQITDNFTVDDYTVKFDELCFERAATMLQVAKYPHRAEEIRLFRAMRQNLVVEKELGGPYFTLNDNGEEVRELGPDKRVAAGNLRSKSEFRAIYNQVNNSKYGIDTPTSFDVRNLLEDGTEADESVTAAVRELNAPTKLISATKTAILTANKAELLHFLNTHDPEHIYDNEYSNKELQMACLDVMTRLK
jgi:hypothetical protein